METFGEYVKTLRIKKGLTLRDFCSLINTDPSNWSKIERGILVPPKSKLVLDSIAQILDLEVNSEKYNALFDLAAISYIPPQLISDKEILEKLPIFFRTARGESPTKIELEKLIKLIKEA